MLLHCVISQYYNYVDSLPFREKQEHGLWLLFFNVVASIMILQLSLLVKNNNSSRRKIIEMIVKSSNERCNK